jgi:hypothetical protein
VGWSRSGQSLWALIASCADGPCALPPGARPVPIAMAFLVLLIGALFVTIEIAGAALVWTRRVSQTHAASQQLLPGHRTGDCAIWSRKQLRSTLRAVVGISACSAAGVAALLVKLIADRAHMEMLARSGKAALIEPVVPTPTLGSCAGLVFREARLAVGAVAAVLLALLLLPIVLWLRERRALHRRELHAVHNAKLEALVWQKEQRIKELEAAVAAMLAISEGR